MVDLGFDTALARLLNQRSGGGLGFDTALARLLNQRSGGGLGFDTALARLLDQRWPSGQAVTRAMNSADSVKIVSASLSRVAT